MLDVFVSALFRENLALVFFLGLCTFLAASRRLETAVGLGLALIVVQGLSVPLNYMIHHAFLRAGAWAWLGWEDVDLGFLRLIAFIGVIAAMVQILEIVLLRFFPVLHRSLGIFLPLITVNCAILGGSLFMVERQYDFGESIAFGLGSGVGWALALCCLAALRERMHYSDVPRGLRGLGIAFIVIGLMSMAFTGYAGLALK
ncbi:NADH:ubiquinone reductase (Na(+)-transporting) subunit E [Pseudomarimonas arenosa]|uniref:NADH:ubiquinone reductase (Na(+)-transporting) subunit E n=1 Tax=Pseudomarimonas arenosa TaxID=2774145 RepID=A0AAW3ZLS1_9GAMM|nr:NADH:ubiquinone reductase (Na(+)-transporting) subunit E [Pseudomarimonas arenosa]MBD8526119.1 NADH:ubiquinone reductase (Na(+)-transporting) subunit E [Pseudomarimonas arenosa]